MQPASLVVIDPNGHRTRVAIDPLPFRIGRQPDSNLIIRDSRASRTHARIVEENGEYVIEDCGSLHGTYVNGKRITRQALRDSDKIEFGAQDSYQLIFALDGAELKRLMEQVSGAEKAGAAPGVPSGPVATWPSCAPFWTWRAQYKARFRWTTCWRRWWTRRWPSRAPSAASCCCARGAVSKRASPVTGEGAIYTTATCGCRAR